MAFKLKLVSVIFAIEVVKELIDLPYRAKYLEIVKARDDLIEKNAVLSADLTYLIQVINDSDLELDEFDLLVLTHVTEKH